MSAVTNERRRPCNEEWAVVCGMGVAEGGSHVTWYEEMMMMMVPPPAYLHINENI